MPEALKVANRSELPPGGRTLLEVDGRAIALFNVDGTFYAIDDVCTHDGGPLAEGDLDGCAIECPRHGARFDVRTGKPLCMPAVEPVATHQVEVARRRGFRRRPGLTPRFLIIGDRDRLSVLLLRRSRPHVHQETRHDRPGDTCFGLAHGQGPGAERQRDRPGIGLLDPVPRRSRSMSR